MSLEENNKIDQYGVWLKKTPLLDEKKEHTEIEVEDISEDTISYEFFPIDDTEKDTKRAESPSFDSTEENIQDDFSDFIEQSKEDFFDEEMSSLLDKDTSQEDDFSFDALLTEEVIFDEIQVPEDFFNDEYSSELTKESKPDDTNFFESIEGDIVFPQESIPAGTEIVETDEEIIDFGGELVDDPIIDTTELQAAEIQTENFINQENLETAAEDVSLEAFSDGEVDLSAFFDESENEKDSAKPPKTEEVSLDDFSDGEIDLSSFMDSDTSPSPHAMSSDEINIDDFLSGTQSLHVDSFLTNETPKEDSIFEEEPIDIELVFDDAFASEAISNPSEDIEIFYTSDSDAEFESFNVDDLFDDTEELFETEKISPQTVTYEDVNEFDDLLSSLDESSPSVIEAEVHKDTKPKPTYNITVRVDDDNKEKSDSETEKTPVKANTHENQEGNDLDDIPLFLDNQKFTSEKDLEKNTTEEYTNLTRQNKGANMEFNELDEILDNVEILKETVKQDISADTEHSEQFQSDMLDESMPSKENDLNVEEDDIILENAETEAIMEDSTDTPIDTSIDTDIELTETIQFDLDEDSQGINETEIFFEDEDDEISIEIDMPEDDSSEAISTDIEDALYEEKTEIEVDTNLDNDNLDSINEIDNLASMSEDFDDSLDTMENFEHFDVDSDLDLSMSIDNTLLEERNTVEKTQNTEKFLLEQIANEISSLRNEISELKKELACSTEKKASTEADISNGFFSGSEEDEVIALSGDELNNILINADFTEKTPLTDTELSLEDEAEISLDEDAEFALNEEAEISLDDETEISLDEDAEISLDDDAEFSLDDEAEISLDEDSELFLDEDAEFALDEEAEISLDEDAEFALNEEAEISLDDETEISLDDDAELSLEDDAEISLDDDTDLSLDDDAEISLDDDAELSLEDDAEISLDDDTEISLDEEELEEEFFEENLIEPSEEELDINTIVANNEELIDTITIDSSELVVPSADSDLLEVPVDQDNDLENPEINAIADFEDELLLDVEEEDLSEIIPEAIEPDRDTEIDDENSYNEPTDEVFNSEQWGFDDDASPSLEDEEKSIPETESPATNSLIKNIQDKQIQEDIKSVLVYMDQLLENLPEDKIEEFAKSENFVVYKKLFTELGLV